MSPSFEPCSGCSRHVRRDETACPFCGEAFAPATPAEPPRLQRRLRRALVFAFRAGLAGVAAASCGDDGGGGRHDGGVRDASSDADAPDADSGSTSGDAGSLDPREGGAVPIYAAPPPDTPLPGEKE